MNLKYKYLLISSCFVLLSINCNQHLSREDLISGKFLGDIQAPHIIKVSPVNNSIDVEDTAEITITFDENIDLNTINSKSVIISINDSEISGIITYDQETFTVRFRPSNPLLTSSNYNVKIKASITDLNGNKMISDYVTTFTTSACPSVKNAVYKPNGRINVMKQIGCNIYLGGQFTSFSEEVGHAFLSETETGEVSDLIRNLSVNGTVNQIISDGNGGWYIVGDFTQVGQKNRERIAHITKNGLLGDFSIEVNNSIRTILKDNNKLLIGGNFTAVNQTQRNYFAVLSTSGELLSTDPNPNNIVYKIKKSNNIIYVVGSFSQMGGQTRKLVSTFNSDLQMTTWAPDIAGSSIRDVAFGSTKIFFGGDFLLAESQIRQNLVAYDSISGNIASWEASTNGIVYALTYNSNTSDLIAGGAFTSIKSLSRSYLAAISDDFSGSVQNFNPAINGTVYALENLNNKLYVGGNFSCINSCASISHGAALSLSISFSCIDSFNVNCIFNWSPKANSLVYALSVDSKHVFLGGTFKNRAVTINRNRLAAIRTDGRLLNWDPSANGEVSALATSDDRIYIGGSFTCLGAGCSSGSHNRLGAIQTDGTILNWPVSANNIVRSLEINNNIIYLGGAFTQVQSTNRNYLAALDLTGNLQSWDPNANNQVFDIAVLDNKIYVVGSFTSIASQTRNRFAALGTSGTLDNLQFNINDFVSSIYLVSDKIILGGTFTSINSIARNRFAVLDYNGNVSNINIGLLGSSVIKVSASDNFIYLAGIFTSLNGVTRNNLARINHIGSADDWAYDTDNAITSLLVDSDKVFIGGDFQKVKGTTKGKFAVIQKNNEIW